MRIDGILVHESVTAEVVAAAARRHQSSLDDPGICLYCGEETDGVEPDARGYDCSHCGEPGVYGAEELLMYFIA